MCQKSVDLPRISSDSLPRQRSPRRSSAQFHRSPELARFSQKRHAGEVSSDPDNYHLTYWSLDKRKRNSGPLPLEVETNRPNSTVGDFISDSTRGPTITTVKEEEPDLIIMNDVDEQSPAAAALNLEAKRRVPNDWVQVEL